MLVESETNPAVMPDTVAFTTAIRAWGGSGRCRMRRIGRKDCGEMLSLVEDGVIVDATVMYNTVLDALVRSNVRGWYGAGRRDFATNDDFAVSRRVSGYGQLTRDFGWTS
jgi:hypothetical protein